MKTTAIRELLNLIEKQLNWGDVNEWPSKDFEKLNLLILEKTKVSLSASTLRRLWGKVDYNHQPSGTTLDTLAQFAGYESWREFTSHIQLPEAVPPAPITVKEQFNSAKWFKIALSGIGGVALLLLISYIIKSANPVINARKYSFSSRTITRDVPNSVVFTYNAQAAPTDSVFVQQSWDSSKRSPVAKNGHQYTSIYYRPGFYLAKLVIGQQIVKEHPLLISTNGWLGMIAQKPVPVYLAQNEFKQNGELRITPSTVLSKGLTMSPNPPVTEFYNVGNFKAVPLTDFFFSTEVKNEYNEGAAKCQLIKVVLLTDETPIAIPLSAPGCIAKLNLMNGVDMVSGKSTDLSGFGVDLSKWVKVLCRSKGKKIQYFVNDKLVYESQLPAVKRSILGIGFTFQGAGAVKNIQLSSNNIPVFQ
ncbi:hypothetical protein [Pedobacter sp. L105]|uniref:hypothetical protein n=1 Tax=Pedobacter sp. L105 TaxID=1641871 RepID=UPI00131C8E27|nr:hypothetical protein [Pedobacter sp. L105]